MLRGCCRKIDITRRKERLRIEARRGEVPLRSIAPCGGNSS